MRSALNSAIWSWRTSLAVGIALAVAGCGAVASAQTPAQAGPSQQTPQQLDDLVAPITLYPDPLLGQVLAASTYPLEIVEAQQWLARNGGLTGTALMDAARRQNWDPSVQALVAFPEVLAKLNQDVRWTTDLGNAFLAQQADVMQAVQTMRASAQSKGRLSSSPQQVVTNQTDDGQSAIEIQPANPQVIYVPTYDPAYVWGPPAYGYYPSLLYPEFGFGYWPGIDVGLSFGGWGGGWGGWGWGTSWFGGGLFINGGFFRSYGFRGGFGGVGAWAHNPDHRLGVGYPNAQLANRYQAASRSSAAAMGSRYGAGQSFGANRGYARSQTGANQSASRFGAQSYRGSAVGNAARGYQSQANSAPRYNGGASRSFSGGTRGFGGGGARSFGGGGGHSSGGGGGHRR